MAEDNNVSSVKPEDATSDTKCVKPTPVCDEELPQNQKPPAELSVKVEPHSSAKEVTEDHGSLFREPESLRFLFGLSSCDPSQRSQALETIHNSVKTWLESCPPAVVPPAGSVTPCQSATSASGTSSNPTSASVSQNGHDNPPQAIQGNEINEEKHDNEISEGLEVKEINGLSNGYNTKSTAHEISKTQQNGKASAQVVEAKNEAAQPAQVTDPYEADQDVDPQISRCRKLLHDQLPDLVRLASQCPYEDVREGCSKVLLDIKDHGIILPASLHKGPSSFIPTHEVVAIDSNNDRRAKLFTETFVCNNRLDHIVHVLGYHPKYLTALGETQKFLLQGEGPLRYDHRHYIAILASARHQCSYLVNSQTAEFLQQHGDGQWLKGFQHAPEKLQQLQEVNKILAHRPWLLTSDHIESLQEAGWSLSELMHAIVILAHFHALSSFVYGCGVSPEIDHHNGHTYNHNGTTHNSTTHAHNQNNNLTTNGTAVNGSERSSSTTPTSDLQGGIEVLMERMKRLIENQEEEISEEEKLKRFQKLESQHAELPSGTIRPPKANISCYIMDPDFSYKDFFTKNTPSDIPTIRAQDHSWEDHCQPIADNLYTDIGVLLDDKFRTTTDLTYNTMGDNENVDTSSFRRAVWNYIHCIYGIRQDDYDYSEVNQLLEKPLKSYIKTVTCYPERITKKDYDSFMCEFKHSEKVHVNLMILEARLQAELLYALKAIMKTMQGKST